MKSIMEATMIKILATGAAAKNVNPIIRYKIPRFLE